MEVIDPIPFELDVDDLLDWLDELWESGYLTDWTYEDYLDFRKTIEACGDYE